MAAYRGFPAGRGRESVGEQRIRPGDKNIEKLTVLERLAVLRWRETRVFAGGQRTLPGDTNIEKRTVVKPSEDFLLGGAESVCGRTANTSCGPKS